MSASIETDCQSVAARLKRDAGFVLIDCREADEFAIAHIDGARLVPMTELAARLEELRPLAQHDIAIHCHHGGRSLKVAHWLRAQGFSNAQSMSGGIDEWSQTIDTSVPRY